MDKVALGTPKFAFQARIIWGACKNIYVKSEDLLFGGFVLFWFFWFCFVLFSLGGSIWALVWQRCPPIREQKDCTLWVRELRVLETKSCAKSGLFADGAREWICPVRVSREGAL